MCFARAGVRRGDGEALSVAQSSALANSALIVFAREDDFTLGVLQSRIHEVWALALGTALEDVTGRLVFPSFARSCPRKPPVTAIRRSEHGGHLSPWIGSPLLCKGPLQRFRILKEHVCHGTRKRVRKDVFYAGLISV